jgi:hypothetical protein
VNTLTEFLLRLRWSLAIFLVLAAAGVAVALVSQQFIRQAHQREQQLTGQLSDIHAKLSTARDETEEIRGKISRYQELAGRGVIGQEERLDWVEKIAKIKTARRLFDVQYELAPQKPADPAILPDGAAGGGFEFMASPMKLQMQLLHEDDLLGFLADLRQSVRAILLVRNCTVERLPRNPNERNLQPQLKADCDIDWITLREKK